MVTDSVPSWLQVAKVSGAFMAFLIGSGFATGQEAMQFFATYGEKGVWGVLVTVLLFVYSCRTLLLAGHRYGLRRNQEVFRHFCGPYIGVFLTWYTMIFIVAVHAIMLAGAGATLKAAYGINSWIGALAMGALSMTTLLLGLRRIVDVMGFIGPLIIILTISVAVSSLFEHAEAFSSGARKVTELELLQASPHWLMSAVLYVGLTLPGLASFLPAVGASSGSERELKLASIAGPLLFTLAMILVVSALLASITRVHGVPIPVITLASGVFPLYGTVFAAVIFMGIYTTVTPLAWTVCERFTDEGTPAYRMLVVVLTVLGLVGGTILPFEHLVNIIYPTVGYAGLLFFCCAIFRDIRAYWRSR